MYNLELAKQFLDSIEEPYAMIFDKDSDGICSAALIYKYLLAKGVTPGLATCKDESGVSISPQLLSDLRKFRHVIFLDMPMDQSSIANSLPGERVLVIDHHVPIKDLNSERVIHINPRFESAEIYLPTSYLAYKITESKNEKFCWISGVGVVADYGVRDCKDLIDTVAKTYPNLVVEDKYSQREMWKSGLGFMSDVIAAACGVEGIKGANMAFYAFSHAESSEDVTRGDLLEWYKVYQAEIEREKNDFRSKAKYFPATDSYLNEVKSKYRLMGVLSTMVSEEHPNSVILNYVIGNTHLELSARCQSGRVDVAKLMREVTKDLGTGGGHPKAAGGGVPLKHKQEVLDRIQLKLSGF